MRRVGTGTGGRDRGWLANSDVGLGGDESGSTSHEPSGSTCSCSDSGSSEEAALSTGVIATWFGGPFWFESDSQYFSTDVSNTRKRRQRVVNQEIA